MADQITIPARFRGPPQSGNGGYVARAIARCIEPNELREGNAVQVTLRAPITLDTPMSVAVDEGQLTVTLGAQLIAEAERCMPNMKVPTPPSFAEARASRAASPSF